MSVFLHPATLAVTVVIPARNEEHRIDRCLDSISNTSLPADQVEVLVVDGMSTDETRCVVTERSMSNPCIRLLDNPQQIVPCALNIGVREARGKVVAITGAHCVYPPDYIATCIRELERTQADTVGGVLITRPGSDSLIARAISLMTQHPLGVGNSAFRTGRSGHFVDTVPYGVYRREVFDRVGLFNERLRRNQDFEFNARVRSNGGKLFLTPAVEVIYYNVPTIRQLAIQAFNNGRWLASMWRLSPESFRVRHSVPLLFVLVLLLCIALAPLNIWAVFLGAAILGLHSLAAIGAAIQISSRNGKELFVPLLPLFLIHHLMHGAGTLVGLLHPPTAMQAPKQSDTLAVHEEQSASPATR